MGAQAQEREVSAEPPCSEIECGQQRDHPNHNSGNPDGHFFHIGKPLLDPNVKREPPPADEVKSPSKWKASPARRIYLRDYKRMKRARKPFVIHDGSDDLVVALELSLVKARAEKASAAYLVGAFLLTATAPMTTSELSKALSAQEGRYVAPPRVNGGLRTLLKHELVICVPRLSRRGQKVTGSVNAWWPSDSLAVWVSRQGVTG